MAEPTDSGNGNIGNVPTGLAVGCTDAVATLTTRSIPSRPSAAVPLA